MTDEREIESFSIEMEKQWEPIEQLLTQNSTYKSGAIINPENFENYYYSSTKKMVPSYNFAYEVMSSYSGYSNHCSPTAAVNLLKYWYLRNNQKYNCLLKTSWLNSFKLMYGYMGTNPTIGTYTSKLVNAYKSYFNNCSGLGYVMVDLYSSPSMSKIAEEINAGYPFHINVYGNGYYGNHSMLALGYNYYTYRNGNTYTYSYYVMVADGWVKSPRYVNCKVGVSGIDMVTVRLP